MTCPGNLARVAGRLKWVEKRPISWLVGHISRHSFGSRTDVHFFVDMLQMAAHRFHADGQLVGDFLVGITLGEQDQDLPPRARSGERRIWATWSRRGTIPPRAGPLRWSWVRRRAAPPAAPVRKSAGFGAFQQISVRPRLQAMKTSSSSSTAVRMRIWILGSSSLRRAVHSMPDMRGRKMSISTTSG